MFVNRPQFDARPREGRCHRAQQRAQVLLELGLDLRVGTDMTGARHPEAGTEASQVGPAQLTTDVAAETVTKPGGHGSSAPAVALGMGCGHSCSQLCQVCGWQGWSPCTHHMAPVSHAVRAVGVVPSGDLANPICRIAGHGGYSARRQSTAQQPQNVPAAALNRVAGVPIPAMKFVVGQMGFEMDASWHACVLQQHVATRYQG